MKAILLNGPPGCGKDTIGGILSRQLTGCFEPCWKFAAPIVDFLFHVYGIDMASVEKDKPHDALRGRTPREVAIHYSQAFCKPLYGQDYFGQKVVDRLKAYEETIDPGEVVVFSDSGFVVEAVPVLRHLGKGNVIQVLISRPFHSFERDSRSYWNHPDIGQIQFENKGDGVNRLVADLKASLVPELSKWIKRK